MGCLVLELEENNILFAYEMIGMFYNDKHIYIYDDWPYSSPIDREGSLYLLALWPMTAEALSRSILRGVSLYLNTQSRSVLRGVSLYLNTQSRSVLRGFSLYLNTKLLHVYLRRMSVNLVYYKVKVMPLFGIITQH